MPHGFPVPALLSIQVAEVVEGQAFDDPGPPAAGPDHRVLWWEGEGQIGHLLHTGQRIARILPVIATGAPYLGQGPVELKVRPGQLDFARLPEPSLADLLKDFERRFWIGAEK